MKTQTILSLLFILFLVSCKDKRQDFNEIRKGHSITTSNSKLATITAYSLYYNPKANGTVNLELDNGSVYQAQSLDGGKLSAIILLLKDSRTVFHTERKELIIEKAIDK